MADSKSDKPSTGSDFGILPWFDETDDLDEIVDSVHQFKEDLHNQQEGSTERLLSEGKPLRPVLSEPAR